MKNRGRTEMLATMLEVAKGKATKTKIMYSSFSKLCAIKGLPCYFDRKQSDRIS